ncbi:hypothetical protein P8605_11445 [Streptomyces sp. T-3]|nr:hypothetical protein [Streptomyces sp. T-3]
MSEGFYNLKEWGELPPEHLLIAIEAREREQQRQAEATERAEDRRHAVAMAELDHRKEESERAWRHETLRLRAGIGTTVASIGGALFFGYHQDHLMAGLMLGPSLLAVIKMFVLKRSDPVDARAGVATLNAAGQAPPPI